jgi:uncharacterized Tic20 family protein
MTESPLRRSVKLRAMWCHLSALSWLVMATIDFAVNRELSRQQPPIWIDWRIVLPIQIALAYIIPLTVWLFSRRIHRFVDLAGKAAINYILTISIWSLAIGTLLFSLLVTICGSYFFNPTRTSLKELIEIFLLFSLSPAIVFFALPHLVCGIIAAAKASRGQFFHYLFSFNILR